MSKVALVVDDSSTVRKIVGRTLLQAGFQVVEAGNGQEALEALARCAVTVIVTDYNMPVMDGLEFARGVRETVKDRGTPMIFLTTESESSKREEATAAGANAWLTKPFRGEELISVINRVVPAP
jgi:two-component system chemotaxis response regulator CheY